MKDTFIKKYKDYCKARKTKDEIFRMIQGPNDSLEDYKEQFKLIYKQAHACTSDEKSIKLVLLKGVRE